MNGEISVQHHHIRKIRPEDLSEIQNLWIKAGIELTTSDSIKELQKMLDHNPDLCLLIEDASNRSIIGAVLGGFDGRRGWIHHLAVDPQFQRQGIGKKLMTALTRIFHNQGVVKLKLEILNHNRDLISFYESLGWETRLELCTMSKTLRFE